MKNYPPLWALRRFALRMYYQSSSKRYVEYLRKQGIEIGENCRIRPKTARIDVTRPSLVSIGDNCYMNENFTLLTHDWVSNVFIHSERNFVNSSGKVRIGNNVSFGQNVMVLKGVTIGDNCFIGAGSIVTRDIPANSIAVGTPCRVVMSLEDYYQKRLIESQAEAMEYAKSIYERFGRMPVIDDFWEEFPFFVDGKDIDKYPRFRRQLGPSYERYKAGHHAPYPDLATFLKAAGIE